MFWLDNSLVGSFPINHTVLQMQVKETKMNKLQYFQVRKMSKFTQDANGLKKFSTEATDLRFPQQFIINYRTKILGTVSLLYFDAIHKKLNAQFQELVEVNIIYSVLLEFIC